MELGNRFISSTATGSFPPPISCMGRRGKPCFSLKSYRHDGRFVLREIEIPNHELLHALREDGHLKLHLFPSTEIFIKEAKGEEAYDDDYVDANEEDENDDEEENKSIATDEICKGHESLVLILDIKLTDSYKCHEWQDSSFFSLGVLECFLSFIFILGASQL